MFLPNLPKWIAGPLSWINRVVERDYSHIPQPWRFIWMFALEYVVVFVMLAGAGLWIVICSLYAIPKKIITGRWPLEEPDPFYPEE